MIDEDAEIMVTDSRSGKLKTRTVGIQFPERLDDSSVHAKPLDGIPNSTAFQIQASIASIVLFNKF
jgi:hypothetical protein